jgi:hypothetical protein
MVYCAKEPKSTYDTILTKKVWAGSHLEKPYPECYIIVRKGDTNVQVKPKLFREREQRGIYEREVKLMLDTKNLKN